MSHAGREDAVAFVSRSWIGIIDCARQDEVRTSHIGGAFALTTDAELDRLILDAHHPNDLEPNYFE